MVTTDPGGKSAPAATDISGGVVASSLASLGHPGTGWLPSQSARRSAGIDAVAGVVGAVRKCWVKTCLVRKSRTM